MRWIALVLLTLVASCGELQDQFSGPGRAVIAYEVSPEAQNRNEGENIVPGTVHLRYYWSHGCIIVWLDNGYGGIYPESLHVACGD